MSRSDIILVAIGVGGFAVGWALSLIGALMRPPTSPLDMLKPPAHRKRMGGGK